MNGASLGRKFPATGAATRALFAAILVLTTLILVNYYREYYLNYLSDKIWQFYDESSLSCRQEDERPATNEHLPVIKEQFVWSELIDDWTLTSRLISINRTRHCLWPDDECQSASRDRIIDQLQIEQQSDKIYKILPHDLYSVPEGRDVFVEENCPVKGCQITHNQTEADVLIFQNSDVLNEPPRWRRKEQIWIAYLLESPTHTFDKRFKRKYRGNHEFNWTATYRTDSDIVTPYSKFVPYEEHLGDYRLLKEFSKTRKHQEEFFETTSEHQKNLIRSKTGMVAWFASNCNAANNRLEYAHELSRFTQVDIFGRCGNRTCLKWNQTGCLEMINKKYKFYLSFENSNCPLYITEKLYQNALGFNDINHLVIPIVMGPSKKDYEMLAPPLSFIHIDDFESAEKLALYLKALDEDDTAYNYYFAWKTVGRFIDTKFICRVCALAHNAGISDRKKSYRNIRNWWTTYIDSNNSSSSCSG